MSDVAFKNIVRCIVPLLIVNIPEAQSAHVIYGLDKAQSFHMTKKGPYTIQAGAFLSESMARQLKNKLTETSHYPVRIHLVGQFYTVLIGPISSEDGVRAVGSNTPFAPHVPTIARSSARKISRQYDAPAAQMNRELQKPSTSHVPIEQRQRWDRPIAKESPSAEGLGSPYGGVKHHKGYHTSPQSQLSPSVEFVSGNHLNHGWFLSADLGGMQSHMDKVMTVNNGSDFPPPSNLDQYSAKKYNPVMLALAGGYRWNRDEQWIPAYAVALRYQHLFTQDISGSVTQYSLPEFRNYSYNWGVSVDALSLYSKVDIAQYGRFMPYVDAGLGMSFNHSDSYFESPYADVTPRVSPGYGSATHTQLTYNVGAGIDILLSPRVMMSLGYDYQSFGDVTSGNGQFTWAGERLKLGKLSTNTIFVGATYAIND